MYNNYSLVYMYMIALAKLTSRHARIDPPHITATRANDSSRIEV